MTRRRSRELVSLAQSALVLLELEGAEAKDRLERAKPPRWFWLGLAT